MIMLRLILLTLRVYIAVSKVGRVIHGYILDWNNWNIERGWTNPVIDIYNFNGDVDKIKKRTFKSWKEIS